MTPHTYFDLKLLHVAWQEIARGLPLSSSIADLWSICVRVLDRDPIETLARDVAAHIAEQDVIPSLDDRDSQGLASGGKL